LSLSHPPNEGVRENALRMKELEVKEKELAMQVRLKELKVSAVSLPSDPGSSKPAGFHFVPPFQEQEVDKYFLHFEKVATSLNWPRDN